MLLRIACLAGVVSAGFLLRENQDSPPARFAADLNELHWISGRWEGPALDGEVEESWSTPKAGTMIGSFRLTKGSQTPVIEFMIVEQSGDQVIYRFMHFDSKMVSWEKEALTFELVELEEGHAAFEAVQKIPGKPRRLIYELVGEDALTVKVEGWDVDASGNPSFFNVPMRRPISARK